MLSYSWPGNARELDNVIQRALVLQTQGIIEEEHLQITNSTTMPSEEKTKGTSKNLQIHEYELIEKHY